MLILSSRAIKFVKREMVWQDRQLEGGAPAGTHQFSHHRWGGYITNYHRQYNMVYTYFFYKYTPESVISKLLVSDDKLNHIGWVEPQIINPEI